MQSRKMMLLTFVCTAHIQICTDVKDSIYICRKRVGLTLTAGGVVTQEYTALVAKKQNKKRNYEHVP